MTQKENGPHGAEGRRADDGTVRVGQSRSPIPFRLVRCEPCEFGAKRAEATIEVDGLGVIDCDYFRPVNGRSPFAIARSVRSKYTGSYERVVRFENEFAEAVRVSIEERFSQLEAVSI